MDENVNSQNTSTITTNPAPFASQQTEAAEDSQLEKKWSWGAFMLDPFFLIAVRRYGFLLLYLLYLIPILNFLAIIGIKIFLGVKGSGMVRESRTFLNDDERRGFLKAIDHAGLISFFGFIALFILIFVTMMLLRSLMH